MPRFYFTGKVFGGQIRTGTAALIPPKEKLICMAEEIVLASEPGLPN
jgi:hypothetical protein